jgi:hypothetical protein
MPKEMKKSAEKKVMKGLKDKVTSWWRFPSSSFEPSFLCIRTLCNIHRATAEGHRQKPLMLPRRHR